MKTNLSLIPIILVEAPSPDNGSFHWGDFYERFLDAALEPMIERKSVEKFEAEFRDRTKRAIAFAGLRRAVEQCITHRRTRNVVIDEAQDLTKDHNARPLQEEKDTIKSLARLAGVQCILMCTY